MLTEENRRHIRIKEDISIRWCSQDYSLAGNGFVRDISVSGALAVLDISEPPSRDEQFFVFPQDSADASFLPNKVRLVWRRPSGASSGKYLCGMEFVEPAPETVQNISGRVDSWLARMSEGVNINILNRTLRGYSD